MKINRNLIVAVAVGVAIAGIAGFLLGTDKGKQVAKKIKERGGTLGKEMSHIAEDAKKKFNNFKEEALKKVKKDDYATSSLEAEI